MTIYVLDADSLTPGAGVPSGLTSRLASVTGSVVDAGGGDHYVQMTPSSSARCLLSLDAVDGDADRDDLNVLAEIETPSVATSTAQCGIGARMSGSSGSDTGAFATIYGTEIRATKVISGTTTPLGTTTGKTLAADTRYLMRVDCQGSGATLRVKVWPAVDGEGGEPGTWDLEALNPEVTAAGWIGFWGFNNVAHKLHRIAAGTNGDVATFAGDSTAPVLTSPTGTATGSTTATVGATTDEGNGTQYAFVSTSATPPSATDLKAGTGATWAGSITISSTGANTHNATGLTASTGYYAHLIHTDAAANDSNIVTSAQFTTSAANSAPSWSGTPSAMSAKKGQALTPQDITSLVSDADLDTLSYSITGAPTGVTINSSSGVISGTPTAAPGVYACTVEADDGIASPVSSASFDITVTQCVLALTGAGYNFGDGNDVDTIAAENAVAWEVAVVADELPVTATLYHSASSTTSSTGYLSDIGDDDLVFGTTYVVQARRVSDGEWITFPITAG